VGTAGYGARLVQRGVINAAELALAERRADRDQIPLAEAVPRFRSLR
jgi:hypothetical protein